MSIRTDDQKKLEKEKKKMNLVFVEERSRTFFFFTKNTRATIINKRPSFFSDFSTQ